MDRRDRTEPLGARPLDLGGDLRQQILAAEIAVKLNPDRQPVPVEAGWHRDAGQAGLVRRRRVTGGVESAGEPLSNSSSRNSE